MSNPNPPPLPAPQPPPAVVILYVVTFADPRIRDTGINRLIYKTEEAAVVAQSRRPGSRVERFPIPYGDFLVLQAQGKVL